MKGGSFFMPRKSNKNNKYSKELIESILKEHFENHYSSYYLSKKYGIPRGSIENWILKIQRPDLFPEPGSKRGRPSDSKTDWKQRYEILKKYHAFLKAQRERK